MLVCLFAEHRRAAHVHLDLGKAHPQEEQIQTEASSYTHSIPAQADTPTVDAHTLEAQILIKSRHVT